MKPFPQVKSMLVPIKGDIVDHQAFKFACHIAKENKAIIYAVHVIEVSMDKPVDVEIIEETQQSEIVLGPIEDIARSEKCPVRAEIVQGRKVGPAIIQEATERDVHLIILGTRHANEFETSRTEDTTSYILRNSSCPVILWQEAMHSWNSNGGSINASSSNGK